VLSPYEIKKVPAPLREKGWDFIVMLRV